VVVEGRDIGTVVSPDSPAKFFVTASPLVRATRRALQFAEGDSNREPAQINKEAERLAARDEIDSNREVSPLTQATGAKLIDSTDLNVFETVAAMESHLLKSLGVRHGLPKVAVVGRPNVGKSTLVNRLTASGQAVTEDRPGVTRDAVSYECEWNNRNFQLIDTGGWAQKGEELGLKIADIAKDSASRADLVLFVVDASVGVTAEDEQLGSMLRKLGVPVLLVANKSDDVNLDAAAASFWSLGFGEPQHVSGLQGRHSGDLLDEIVARLPEPTTVLRSIWPKVAIVGQPNVGKSSLLNALAGSQIAMTADMPGTTVDPIDEVVQIGDRVWQLMDTAGLRRKSHTAQGHEYYASIRSERVIEESDLVLLLIDATNGVGEQDKRLANLIDDYGRGLVVVMNKWDLLDEESRERIEVDYEKELGHVSWAPRVNISATTGRNLSSLTKALATSWDSYKMRVGTARLNALIEGITVTNPHPIRGGKQPKLKYASQVGTRPPTFVLHTRGKLDATYLRFIERRLREEFGFEGAPLRLRVKAQKRS
jgi:GTP-binding protein